MKINLPKSHMYHHSFQWQFQFQLVHLSKWTEYKVVWNENLLGPDERTNVKIFTGTGLVADFLLHYSWGDRAEVNYSNCCTDSKQIFLHELCASSRPYPYPSPFYTPTVLHPLLTAEGGGGGGGRGGETNVVWGGTNPIFCQKFPQTHEIKEILVYRKVGPKSIYVDPPLRPQSLPWHIVDLYWII